MRCGRCQRSAARRRSSGGNDERHYYTARRRRSVPPEHPVVEGESIYELTDGRGEGDQDQRAATLPVGAGLNMAVRLAQECSDRIAHCLRASGAPARWMRTRRLGAGWALASGIGSVPSSTWATCVRRYGRCQRSVDRRRWFGTADRRERYLSPRTKLAMAVAASSRLDASVWPERFLGLRPWSPSGIQSCVTCGERL